MSASTIVSSKNIIASSSKVRTFVLVFSLSAVVLYVLGIVLGLASFTYHPGTGRLEWGQTMARRNEGPVMYWYGWILTAFIGASVLGFLATLIPESVTRRIPLALLWIIPLLALPIMAYTLMK
jgi:hypothetical protein